MISYERHLIHHSVRFHAHLSWSSVTGRSGRLTGLLPLSQYSGTMADSTYWEKCVRLHHGSWRYAQSQLGATGPSSGCPITSHTQQVKKQQMDCTANDENMEDFSVLNITLYFVLIPCLPWFFPASRGSMPSAGTVVHAQNARASSALTKTYASKSKSTSNCIIWAC